MVEMVVETSTGADGDDKFIEVPLGTVVKIKKPEILFEITEDGENKFYLAVERGLGNWHFRSSTNQTLDTLNRVYLV
jgi:GTP-binding protein